jgi:ParB family transcriptional regulator, chromosome partitioning protein
LKENKMAHKGGLGKGLNALIPTETSTGGGEALYVPVEKIIANPRQPRQKMEDQSLKDLAASIQVHGILQPLIVTNDPGSDQYILIAGERRLRAAQLCNMDVVPVIIRQASDLQRLQLALIENLQRTDLSALETAQAYHQLSEEFSLTHEEIAHEVGKSRESVSNTLRLLKLPETAKQALVSGLISEGHARAILSLPTTLAQTAALEKILKSNLTVRQAEELAREMMGERPPRPDKHAPPGEIRSLEERLRSYLGTKVSLFHGKKGGRLVIHYYSDEELNTLIDQILKD